MYLKKLQKEWKGKDVLEGKEEVQRKVCVRRRDRRKGKGNMLEGEAEGMESKGCIGMGGGRN